MAALVEKYRLLEQLHLADQEYQAAIEKQAEVQEQTIFNLQDLTESQSQTIEDLQTQLTKAMLPDHIRPISTPQKKKRNRIVSPAKPSRGRFLIAFPADSSAKLFDH